MDAAPSVAAAQQATQRLLELMHDPDVPPSIQLKAASELRKYGSEKLLEAAADLHEGAR